MVRVLAVAIAAALAPLPARATAPVPICRVPTVVDRMAAELRYNPYYTRLDPRLIVESPTSDPRVVRCAICVDIILYDTGRFGDQPAARCEARAFTVRSLRNGFVVDTPR